MSKGTIKYIPKELIDELNATKLQLNIDSDADCFRVMATNNRLAKELKFNLDFKINRRRK